MPYLTPACFSCFTLLLYLPFFLLLPKRFLCRFGDQNLFMETNEPAEQRQIRRRRAKRCRSSSPNVPFVGENHGSEDTHTSTDHEEEDMANCLILLAQGDGPRTLAIHKPGLYTYECKTCNRAFPSFQALGGHSASHKKPKPTSGIPLISFSSSSSQDEWSTSKIVVCSNPGKSTKLHECSICGSEFSSGQALGGHMRRHRSINTVVAKPVDQADSDSHLPEPERNNQESRKPRILLSLDLNLPAPEDDHHHQQLHYTRETKFQFRQAQRPIVFSAAAMIDCHY